MSENSSYHKSNGFALVVVLFILIAIILGSYFLY